MATTIWGIHMEWDNAESPEGAKDIAIGWRALGDLNALPSSRDAFKAAFAAAYPSAKPGAVPVKAGVLYRFAKEMNVGDVIVYPSKADRLVNIGMVEGHYTFLPSMDPQYPHRRRVEWKLHAPRAQFSQPALYEIGSAITLFQVGNNSDEFLADVQADESVEDFVIKRLKNNLSAEQFEHFIADAMHGILRASDSPHRGRWRRHHCA
jgi:restriction system protein